MTFLRFKLINSNYIEFFHLKIVLKCFRLFRIALHKFFSCIDLCYICQCYRKEKMILYLQIDVDNNLSPLCFVEQDFLVLTMKSFKEMLFKSSA